MIDLDLKDRRILYELDVNSRQSFQRIAKSVGLSKDSVIRRVHKLQDLGIIRQFHTVIDVGKLGLISFRLYLKLQNMTPSKEKELINFLKKEHIVTWIASIDGEYDLAVWILVQTIGNMNFFWKDFFYRFGDCIEKRWLGIFTKVVYFPRSFLLDDVQNNDEFVFITEPERVTLDDVDLSLLELLASDARISVLDLSEKLGITSKTVLSHIRQLEKKKVIIGYRTMFDFNALGYQYFKVLFRLQYLTKERENNFKQYLLNHPHIIYDNEVLGGEDVEIELQLKSLEDLRSFLDDVKEKYSDIIKNYSYLLFYKEHKYVFFPTF